MQAWGKTWALLLCVLCLACDSFEEDVAASQIQERFCDGWPYGCTDSTRVVVEKVSKTNRGRQVEFRVVDRHDQTATLSAAYFEPQDELWSFLLFENPFRDQFEAQTRVVGEESKRYNQELRKLKAAQNWFVSIYGRFARSLEELDSVSYKSPDLPIQMTASDDGKSWSSEITTRYVRCELDISRQQLPDCIGVAAQHAGTESGPLAETFGKAP